MSKGRERDPTNKAFEIQLLYWLLFRIDLQNHRTSERSAVTICSNDCFWCPLVHKIIVRQVLLVFTDTYLQQQVMSSISRSVEILILTRPSGPVAETGPSQSSAGWQTKSVSRQDLNSTSRPVTVCVVAAAQRRMRKKISNLWRFVFQLPYLVHVVYDNLYAKKPHLRRSANVSELKGKH